MLSNRRLRLFTALAVTLAAAASQAQNAERQDVAAPVGQVASDQTESNWVDVLQTSITIDQPSGSVAQYIQTIREYSPKINIVVTETAGAHPLPEIKLVNVPVRGTLSLLSSLTNGEIRVEFQAQDEGSDANIVLISGESGHNPEEGLTVRVLNVKRLMQTANREALLSALEEGYRMLENEGTAVEIKIHEATGLLFVKGSPAQLMLAESIVREIEGGLGGANGNPFGQTTPPATTQSETNRFQVPSLSIPPSTTREK